MSNELEQVNFVSMDEFIEAADVTKEVVSIKALGGKNVEVKSLTLREQRDIRKQAMKRDKKGNVTLDNDMWEMGVFILGMSHPKFTEAGFQQLLDKNAAAVSEVVSNVNRVSRMTDDEDEAEAEVAQAQEKFSD